jgi:hypothetical protein
MEPHAVIRTPAGDNSLFLKQTPTGSRLARVENLNTESPDFLGIARGE